MIVDFIAGLSSNGPATPSERKSNAGSILFHSARSTPAGPLPSIPIQQFLSWKNFPAAGDYTKAPSVPKEN
jgi:hypothetical protein